MKYEITQSVRINAETVGKVKKHVKKTKQTIGGFIDLAVEEKIKKDNRLKRSENQL
jgi:hypothetical protein